MKHYERCREGKESVRNLLAARFGVVEVNWDLDLPCKIEDYENTSLGDLLREIHNALQKYRGFANFVKSKKLPRVDFFVPSLSLIVEFDESQHFTMPRVIALGLYPRGRTFGFSVD